MGILSRFSSIFKQKSVVDIDSLEEKSSRVTPLLEDHIGNLWSSPGYGDLGLGDQSYQELQQKYGRSIWIYIATNRIATSCAQTTLKVINKRKAGKPNAEVTTGQGLIDVLRRPNPWMSQDEFVELACLQLLLTGNVFIEKAEVDGRGRARELYLLNPAHVDIVPDKNNYIRGYKYFVNRKSIHFDADDIIHIKLPDPRGESRYGISPLLAAKFTVQADQDALDWNRSFFKNATWPSGIITTQDPMSDEEYKRAKQQLKVNYQGKDKAGKILILEGGLEWHQTTPNPKDLDFLNLRKYSREEILSLYGVPPSIAGIFQFENSTSRSAGTREQAMSFHSDTCQPLLKRILNKLNLQFVPSFSPVYEIVPDLSNIPALRETEEMHLTRAQAFHELVNSGWTISMALAELYPNIDPPKWGEETLAPLGEGQNPSESKPLKDNKD
jgi:HK97 family phage portal protein